ncbi:MAG TPA: YaaR family protein [Clostridia bacterium]|nr:YaaR family protein [Clostridia bacterium]
MILQTDAFKGRQVFGVGMKVKSIQSASYSPQGLASLDEKKNAGSFEHEFQRHKRDSDNSEHERYMHELTERIYKQGEIVGTKADLNEFQKYRALISELLNETVSNAYEFTKTSQFDSIGRQKVFALIRKVNKSLDALAAEILKNEADTLTMMSLVEDIRGLLVDLYY